MKERYQMLGSNKINMTHGILLTLMRIIGSIIYRFTSCLVICIVTFFLSKFFNVSIFIEEENKLIVNMSKINTCMYQKLKI
jgi:hypothetical protein